MKKIYRIFEAPSCESEGLPIDPSPWHFERMAKIPLEHWELIVEFAKTVDKEKTELLDRYSLGTFESDGYLDVSEPTLNQLIDFMCDLKFKLNSIDSIYKFKDCIFGNINAEYEISEYQRMLQAVISVYEEGRRVEGPIYAFNE